jgi:hypothetical protein
VLAVDPLSASESAVAELDAVALAVPPASALESAVALWLAFALEVDPLSDSAFASPPLEALAVALLEPEPDTAASHEVPPAAVFETSVVVATQETPAA